jgi:uncharacterized protein
LEKILMEILGLSSSPSSGGAFALVLSEADGNLRLPIIIGAFEAQAIALELEHIRPPRPMTHDLIKNIILQSNAELKEVVINDLRERTFFAKLVIKTELTEFDVDARPSDAIAIAIRFGVPVFVSAHVLKEAGIVAESESPKTPVSKEESSLQEPISRPVTMEDRLANLIKNLDLAIANEDYEKAARIRDEISNLKGSA